MKTHMKNNYSQKTTLDTQKQLKVAFETLIYDLDGRKSSQANNYLLM